MRSVLISMGVSCLVGRRASCSNRLPTSKGTWLMHAGNLDNDDDDRPAETLQLLRQGHEAPVHVRARGRYLQLPNLSVGWLPGAPPAIWLRRAASGLRDPCSSR